MNPFIASLIASEEGGSGFPTLKRPFATSGSPTPGYAVQMQEDGTVAPLPIVNWAGDSATSNFTGSYAGGGQYRGLSVWPTADPQVFLQSYASGGSTSATLYLRAIRFNADGTSTAGSSSSTAQTSTNNGSGNASLFMAVRLGNSGTVNTFVTYTNDFNGNYILNTLTLDTSTLTLTLGTSVGSATLIPTATASNGNAMLVALDSTTALFLFNDYANGSVKGVTVSSSGTTSTLGTVAVIYASGTSNSVPAGDIDGLLMSTNTVLVRIGGKFVVVTRSGSTLSAGVLTSALTSYSYNALYYKGGSQSIDWFMMLDSTHAVQIWQTSRVIYYNVITISGTTATLGTTTTLLAIPSKYTQSGYLSMPRLIGNTTNKYFMAVTTGNPYTGSSPYTLYPTLYLCTFTYSSGSITVNEAYPIDFGPFTSNSTPSLEILTAALPDGSGSILIFSNLCLNDIFKVGLNSDGTLRIISNAGFGANFTPYYTMTQPISINNNVYLFGGTSWTGSSTTGAWFTYIKLTSWKKGRVWGILQSDGSNVIQLGVSNSHANLQAGTPYYYDSTGKLFPKSVSKTMTYAGRAISSTELYIDQMLYSDPT